MMVLPRLSFEDRDTGVSYGFLRQILEIVERFPTDRIVFAWDSRSSIRKAIYPPYKANRKKDDFLSEEDLDMGRRQFVELRRTILPKMGFHNNFIQQGLEADDIIAQVVSDSYLTQFSKITIVAADNDLYQLLRESCDWTHANKRGYVDPKNCRWVQIYDPKQKTIINLKEFKKRWNVHPCEWSEIKTLAGCSGDNIPGAPGIGEKTAVKFLTGTLSFGSKKHLAIARFLKSENYSLFKQLIQLPHPATKSHAILPTLFNLDSFERTCSTYGFNSFMKLGYLTRWKNAFMRENGR
jgi:DNA polymerase-1